MFYVYILVSNKNDNYIGLTSDLRRRFEEHNQGKVKSTKGKTWQLVYYESYLSKKDAIRRERRLKDDGRARYQLMKRVEASINES